MSDLRSEVRALAQALEGFEAFLAEGPVSADQVEDFKATVDSVRTSVLAMLNTADPSDYRGFVRSYRLRRAAQVCESVLGGLAEGVISRETAGFAEFESTVEETLARLNEMSVRAA